MSYAPTVFEARITTRSGEDPYYYKIECMMRGIENLADDLSGEKVEHHDTLGLREALDMLQEAKDDEARLLDILDEASQELIPDLSDEEAKAEFRLRMELVHQAARERLAVSERLKMLEIRIQERLTELEQLTP